MTKENTRDSHLENLKTKLKNDDPFLFTTHKVLTGKEIGRKNIKNINKKHSEKQEDRDSEEYEKLMTDVHLFIKNEHHSLILDMFSNDIQLSEINNVLRYLLNIAIKKFYFKKDPPSTILKPINNMRKKYKNKCNKEISIIIIDELKGISDSIENKKLKKIISERRIKSKKAEKKAKFILKEIFNHTCSKKELEIKDNLAEIDLEHILPQTICQKNNPDSQWIKDFDKEDREFYAFRIGNLTLLEPEINRSLGNKDFCEKRVKYMDSTIQENCIIAHVSQWTECEIKCRTQIISIRIIEYLDALLCDSE